MSDEPKWEDDILEMLNVPISAQTVTIIQGGAVQALVDLYDKKVTREEFVKSAAPLLELYGQTAKLWLLDNVHTVHKEYGLDEQRFQMAHDGLTKMIAKGVERAVDIVKGLRECPTGKDTIN